VELNVSVKLAVAAGAEAGPVQPDKLADEAVYVNATAAENPLTGATVTADVPDAPTTCVRAVGLAVTVKSWTWTVIVAGWLRVPEVPVTIHV
jgi:hypothetical protein